MVGLGQTRLPRTPGALLGGESAAKTIAQQLAEGRAQAARENTARPAQAKGKEARDDR